MNWYLQSNQDSNIVNSTRIQLARNINGFSFGLKIKGERERLENKIKENLYGMSYGLKFLHLKDMDDITKMSLVEKNLVSPEFVLHYNEIGSILINDDENICIMIGGEEHLVLQVFSSGLDFANTLALAIEIDQKLEELLGYCVSQKYGYLTNSLNNIGTGLKASVMLHLPALTATKNINKLLETISNFGVGISGVYGENSEVLGDIYQIANKQTIGITEQEIVQNVKAIVDKMIKQERQARKFLAKDNIALEDKIYRCYGVLANCRKISYEESAKLLSHIKLGTDLGILDDLTDLKVQKLYLYTKPANLQKYLGEQYEALERDIKRAEVIKEVLKQE